MREIIVIYLGNLGCSLKALTSFYRDGTCTALDDDIGVHAVCIYATKEFLEYSKSVGNDLSTPRPEFNPNYVI